MVGRAEVACEQSGYVINDHFRKARKMVELGSGAVRPVDDYRLTRYACYLIAQNGSSQKPEIAAAQTYFAVQTRRQELDVEAREELERITARHKLTETEKEFAAELVQRDIDGIGIGQIKSRGDKKLFTANTNEMKRRLGVPAKRPLADFLPTVTLEPEEDIKKLERRVKKRRNFPESSGDLKIGAS